MGLSPLARGNRRLSGPCCRGKGPIPARAGQPGAAALLAALPGAYPRSRGATRQPGRPIFCNRGLSPLARGNLNACRWNHADRGPIPARAGQPASRPARRPMNGAYPRSRGATDAGSASLGQSPGLSPLARGNLGLAGDQRGGQRPIPARAGQPSPSDGPAACSRAYPRSRGATEAFAGISRPCRGLSPLARGNQPREPASRLPMGPIPARAGQPPWPGQSRSLLGAYPRSRGATAGVAASNASSKGLSPLARGNRTTGTVRGGGKGPIPARAGQPEVPGIKSPSLTAYPRSRGATSNRWRCRNSPSGLSPLARGNLPRRVNRRIHHGPIPARAGQPAAAAAPRHPKRAYPRSRGATRNTPCTQSSCRGLSPLARGNRHQVLNIRRWQGPIPARAGQPRPGRAP